jgi:hypothetical protein
MKQKPNQTSLLLILAFILVAVYIVSLSNYSVTGSTTKLVTAEVSRQNFPLELKEDEYLVRIDEPIYVQDRKITLKSIAVPFGGVNSAAVVEVDNIVKTVRADGVSSVAGLSIRNLNTIYNSASPTESTAVLKIVEIEPKSSIPIVPPIKEPKVSQGTVLTCSSIQSFKKSFSSCDTSLCQAGFERRLCEERGFWFFKSVTEVCEKIYETGCSLDPSCNGDKTVTASSCIL